MNKVAAEEFLPLKHRELLMLLCLLHEPNHGHALKQKVERRTNGRIKMGPGTLYRTVRALEDSALILELDSAAKAESRKRTYAVTEQGREVLAAEVRRLEALVREARGERLLP